VIRKLLADRECRVCGRPASHGHHLVYRSQGGDDYEGNIIPLCHVCHDKVHAGSTPVRRQIILTLTADERAYVVSKFGDNAAGWAERVYGYPEGAWTND